MIPRRVYLVGAGCLGLVALGYCAGRCSSSDPRAQSQAALVQEQQQQSLSGDALREHLFLFLRRRYRWKESVKKTEQLLSSPSPTSQVPAETSGYILRDLADLARQGYRNVNREVWRCYEEAKAYMEEVGRRQDGAH